MISAFDKIRKFNKEKQKLLINQQTYKSWRQCDKLFQSKIIRDWGKLITTITTYYGFSYILNSLNDLNIIGTPVIKLIFHE